MNTTVLGKCDPAHSVPHKRSVSPDGEAPDDIVAELGAALFSLLGRKDQRRRAEHYLRGLLTTQGRKSIRNIAAHLGRPGLEQSLHHFIASSTWDWHPLRAALADYLEHTIAPQAWVIQPMHIPKAGKYSVGVDQQFAPHLGQVVRGQQVTGAWLASTTLSAPVNWRMVLPESWINDSERRARAEVPERTAPESAEECAVSVALDMARMWDIPRRPAVLDLRRGDVAAATRRLTSGGVPFLTRISPSCLLSVADQALPGHRAGALPARRILELLKGMRVPAAWHDAAEPHTPRASWAAKVPVALPGPATGTPQRLFLVGEWADPARPPSALWLTCLPQMSAASLVRTAKLAGRVERDCERIGERAGLRDFAGRSFRGWHRHMTLASVAHTAIALQAAEYAPRRAGRLVRA
ncbi:transposase [Streptomyces sp. SA15]|uniref:IS701 family transposase n=1 Tax=Streptomyces sp. SA15 TaxID=934019 RepID=UPI000BAF7728|nr:transposase [Streptomyces sp. SA15]PAZ15862.1 transposase [Streptomyces sp. SA15]